MILVIRIFCWWAFVIACAMIVRSAVGIDYLEHHTGIGWGMFIIGFAGSTALQTLDND